MTVKPQMQNGAMMDRKFEILRALALVVALTCTGVGLGCGSVSNVPDSAADTEAVEDTIGVKEDVGVVSVSNVPDSAADTEAVEDTIGVKEDVGVVEDTTDVQGDEEDLQGGRDIELIRKTLFFGALISGDINNVRSMIEAGFNVNTKHLGYTPLIMAFQARFNKADIIRLLLENNADPNIQREDGNNPLLMGVLQEPADIDIIRLFLEHNADSNMRGEDGVMPLMAAAYSENKIEIAELLLRYDADVNALFPGGITSLSIAVRGGNVGMARLLIDNEADVNASLSSAPAEGYTILMTAASRGYVEIVKMLLDAGVDINAKDADEKTALSFAREFDHRDVVTLLIEKGADVH